MKDTIIEIVRIRLWTTSASRSYKAIIDMVIRWLDTNIDDNQIKIQNELFFDSKYYELKEKINLALDPSTTKREIEDGDL